MGSCEVPQTIWARSVQPFDFFWIQADRQTDRQTPRQAKYKIDWILYVTIHVKIRTVLQ